MARLSHRPTPSCGTSLFALGNCSADVADRFDRPLNDTRMTCAMLGHISVVTAAICVTVAGANAVSSKRVFLGAGVRARSG